MASGKTQPRSVYFLAKALWRYIAMSKKRKVFSCCLFVFLFMVLIPFIFLIKWQLRYDVIFINFLNDSENLVFVRENGTIVLQNNQGVHLDQRKFRNLRSVIGKQPNMGMFAFSTNRRELLILEINDRINHCTIPTNYHPDKAVFSSTDKHIVASSSSLFDEIDVFNISQKQRVLKIKSPYPLTDYLFWGHTLWILCDNEGLNTYTIDINDSDLGSEVTLTYGTQQNYNGIIGCKFLHHENRLVLYSKNRIYIVDENSTESKILDCVDNEIVSVLGNTTTKLFVLCKYIDSESSFYSSTVLIYLDTL